MATATPADAGVPVREGVYGDRVVAIEPGGAEFIADSERHGRPLDLFWTWVSPNVEFATVFVGVLPIAIFGGGFWPTAIGVVIGSLLGSITHAIVTAMGPRFGIPQMIQARGSFGYLGQLLPAVLNFLTASFGWFVINSVSGAFALSALTHLDFHLSFLVIVLVQVVVAFLGHNLVHRFELVVFPYLTVVFVIAAIVILAQTHYDLGFNAKAPVAFGGQMGAFSLAVFIAFGYAVGWNPYASDYSRYLPNRPGVGRRAGIWAGLGVFISCAVLEVAGAASATLGGTDPNPTANFIKPLGTILGDLVLVGIAVGAASANALNIYSGAMSFVAMGIKLPFHARRAVVAAAAGVVGLIIGEVYGGAVAPGSSYENFLLGITYWIGPWLGVVLTDYFLRRGEYAEIEFFNRARNVAAGPVAMIAGIVVSIPFWNQGPPIAPGSGPGGLIGWVPFHYAQVGDLSFVAGIVVAAVVYFAMTGGKGSPRTA